MLSSKGKRKAGTRKTAELSFFNDIMGRKAKKPISSIKSLGNDAVDPDAILSAKLKTKRTHNNPTT